MADEDALQSAKNINAALAGDLRSIGIHDLRELRAVGAAEAWDRLFRADLRDDLSSRLALEGAVEGRRWIRLDPEARERCAEHVRRRRVG
jgi:TfoX C-terminal domain